MYKIGAVFWESLPKKGKEKKKWVSRRKTARVELGNHRKVKTR